MRTVNRLNGKNIGSMNRPLAIMTHLFGVIAHHQNMMMFGLAVEMLKDQARPGSRSVDVDNGHV